MVSSGLGSWKMKRKTMEKGFKNWGNPLKGEECLERKT